MFWPCWRRMPSCCWSKTSHKCSVWLRSADCEGHNASSIIWICYGFSLIQPGSPFNLLPSWGNGGCDSGNWFYSWNVIFQYCEHHKLQVFTSPKMCAQTQKDPEMYFLELKETCLFFEMWDWDPFSHDKCWTWTRQGDTDLIAFDFTADCYQKVNVNLQVVKTKLLAHFH